MRKRENTIQLNCFSPPVMLATFAIESCLALYTMWRYKLTVLTRLVVTSLFFLALFQLCEYFVCGGWGLTAARWSRIGYVAITTLPPLGLHELHLFAGKPKRRLVLFAYMTMIAFIAYFLLYSHAFTGYQCTGNYVIFQLSLHPSYAYAIYYYGWLLTAIGLGIKWANELLKAGEESKKQLLSVRGMIIGYLIFLVPTGVANSVKPETRSGIPSIMCGFAVLYALILVLYILPKLAERRRA